MPQLAILLNAWPEFWLQVILWVGLGLASTLGYRRYSYRRMLDDPTVTRGLNPEQRLRRELGLMGTAPQIDSSDAANPGLDGGSAMQAAVHSALADSRRREVGSSADLHPGDLSRLRIRMDHLLRERWTVIAQKFTELGADHTAESWDGLVNHEQGLMALLTDLALELHSAKRQGTYPPVVLQLEGPLGTLADVVRHAQQSLDPSTPPGDVPQLRAGVLAFVADVFPGICQNIHETEVHYDLDPEFELAREVELASQDLPTD